MQGSKLAHHDLGGIDTEAAHDEYRRRSAADWPDRALVAAAGAVLAAPKAAPASSFVLHAPLELLARAGLLAHLAPGAREQARERIAWLAATYEAAGEPVEPAGPFEPAADAEAARSAESRAADLIAAIGAGDLDLVDRRAVQLSEHATALELRTLLGDAVAPSLAAAGHGSILLSLLPRIAAARDVPVSILRGPVRELARHPDWRLRWFDAPDLAESGLPLLDALLAVPVLGSPGNDFIFPIMNQVEASGVAAELLAGAVAGPVDVARARREITRVAAWSMLQEPPTHAPYGWTHCLTMPQAVMSLAGDGVRPRTALAVAATFVAGFRSALGSVALDPTWQPGAPGTTDLGEAIAAGPQAAAATTWHAPEPQLALITSELAARASRHHDAHLVKYTLACIDAAADDPTQRRLYLAAAASLSAWWARHPSDGFFG